MLKYDKSAQVCHQVYLLAHFTALTVRNDLSTIDLLEAPPEVLYALKDLAEALENLGTVTTEYLTKED